MWTVLLAFIAFCNAQPAKWVHPGVLVSGTQLDYIKQQVTQKQEPQYTAFINAQSTDFTPLSYKPKGPPASGTIECGYYSKPDYGCTNDGFDSSAAYAQALFWYITGDQTYANNSIAILNKYASVLQKFNNSNAPLQAAWSSLKMTRAAEIIRHTNAGWSDADYKAYCEMLYRVYIPLIYPGSGNNGNWELSMIEGMLGIAVLSENTTLFQHAVTFWNERVPAYFYNFALDGGKPVPPPRGAEYTGWYGETVFNSSISGLCQETCRDMQHMQMGMCSALNAAETAHIQGTDLYSEQLLRITTGMEFAANILLKEPYPDYLCNHTAVQSISSQATFEVGYNAYHNRLGKTLNLTYTHIIQDVRPIKDQYNFLTNIFETLTHGGSPANASLSNNLGYEELY